MSTLVENIITIDGQVIPFRQGQTIMDAALAKRYYLTINGDDIFN